MNDDWKIRFRERFGLEGPGKWWRKDILENPIATLLIEYNKDIESFIQQEKEKSFEEGKRNKEKELTSNALDSFSPDYLSGGLIDKVKELSTDTKE